MRLKKLSAVLALSALLVVVGREARAALPRNYQEFKARYQQEGRTPEGALKLYFEAVFCYIDEATRAEGSKMVRYALHYDRPIEQSRNLATFAERLRDPERHHIFRSFAAGTSPENDYRMSPDNFNLVVTKKTQEQGYLRVFLQSSGADSPRPVWVKDKAFLDRTKNAHDADYDASPAPAPKKRDNDNVAAPSDAGLSDEKGSSEPSDGGKSGEDDGEVVFK